MKDSQNIEELFKNDYKEPIIEDITPSSPEWTPEFKVLQIYEKEWACEDPLIPDYWIVSSENQKFRADDIQNVLKKLNIIPKSEEEALGLAILMINLLNPYCEIFLNEIEEYKKLSNKYTKEIGKPVIKKLENYYEILLFVFINRFGPFGFEVAESDSLEQWKVKIGNGIYDISPEKVLWRNKE